MKEKYKFEPHNFAGRVIGKRYCLKCGLVQLNNDFTRWAINLGCNNEDHPQYNSMRNRTDANRN